MNVYPISAFTDNYIWAIIDKENALFDCVDPGDANPVRAFAHRNQLDLRNILLTHHHQDHIGGVAQLIQIYPNCEVFGPEDARIPYVTQRVKEKQIINIGSYHYHILFNPGHTSSHISYYEPRQEWLFCGDTLFSAGSGRVFDGTMEQLHQSLQLFKALPGPTKVFAAHEYTLQNLRFAEHVEPSNPDIKKHIRYLLSHRGCSLPSTIAKELEINPFLRTDDQDVINYATQHGALSSESLDVFTILRNQKNNFKY